MTNNDMLLLGGAGLLAYLLLKPKTPAAPVYYPSAPPVYYPPAAPVSNSSNNGTNQAITTTGDLLISIFGGD